MTRGHFSMNVDVAAIQAALAKATPGPWVHTCGSVWQAIEPLPIAAMEMNDGDAQDNADLIVLLRNNAEVLLHALDAERAKVARVEAFAARLVADGYSTSIYESAAEMGEIIHAAIEETA